MQVSPLSSITEPAFPFLFPSGGSRLRPAVDQVKRICLPATPFLQAPGSDLTLLLHKPDRPASLLNNEGVVEKLLAFSAAFPRLDNTLPRNARRIRAKRGQTGRIVSCATAGVKCLSI